MSFCDLLSLSMYTIGCVLATVPIRTVLLMVSFLFKYIHVHSLGGGVYVLKHNVYYQAINSIGISSSTNSLMSAPYTVLQALH